MSEKSASLQILEYLRILSPGAEFTANLLEESLGVSNGAVSGYLAKLKDGGHIRVVGRDGRSSIYQVVDLARAYARPSAGIGSRPGRHHEGVTDAKRAADLLRSLADQVENFKCDLASYTSEELLREVMRRQRTTRAAEGVQ